TCSINRSFVLLLVHLHTIIYFFFLLRLHPRDLHSFPTRRSSDLSLRVRRIGTAGSAEPHDPRIRSLHWRDLARQPRHTPFKTGRSEEHTSELQSRFELVCRLLLEKKKK